MDNLVGRIFPNTEPVTASTVYPVLSKTSVMLNGVNVVFWVPTMQDGVVKN